MLPGVDINELSQVISQQPGGVENLAEMMADMDPDLLEVLGKNKYPGLTDLLLRSILNGRPTSINGSRRKEKRGDDKCHETVDKFNN